MFVCLITPHHFASAKVAGAFFSEYKNLCFEKRVAGDITVVANEELNVHCPRSLKLLSRGMAPKDEFTACPVERGANPRNAEKENEHDKVHWSGAQGEGDCP